MSRYVTHDTLTLVQVHGEIKKQGRKHVDATDLCQKVVKMCILEGKDI